MKGKKTIQCFSEKKKQNEQPTFFPMTIGPADPTEVGTFEKETLGPGFQQAFQVVPPC